MNFISRLLVWGAAIVVLVAVGAALIAIATPAVMIVGGILLLAGAL